MSTPAQTVSGAPPEAITPRIAAGAWYRTEDSWAIALGVGLVAAAVLALVNGSSIKWLAVTPQKWRSPDQLGQRFSVNAGRYLALFVLWISLFGLSTRALGIRALQFPALRASLPARSAAPQAARCGACRAFCNDPLYIERQTPGLHVMSSGFAAARADDGICSVHSRYLPTQAVCERFQARIALVHRRVR